VKRSIPSMFDCTSPEFSAPKYNSASVMADIQIDARMPSNFWRSAGGRFFMT